KTNPAIIHFEKVLVTSAKVKAINTKAEEAMILNIHLPQTDSFFSAHKRADRDNKQMIAKTNVSI
ncbi:MAG: hypothetical protein CL662_10035, partial [Bacteroidetes bacterium]|nr:hypothetical protein [Bacteroidota bacterium]